MNEQFFMPRGLFCLVMAYIPDSNHSHEPNSVTDLISRKLETVGSIRNNLNRHDGKTYGELEMPPAAPLVFLETKPSLNLDSTIIKQTFDVLGVKLDAKKQGEYVCSRQITHPLLTFSDGKSPGHGDCFHLQEPGRYSWRWPSNIQETPS